MSDIDYDSEDSDYVYEIESDTDEERDAQLVDKSSTTGDNPPTVKREHHNFLERKRRDQIKESFAMLRKSVPTIDPEKGASRAQILISATEYIRQTRRKTNLCKQDIERIKKENNRLEAQIKALLKRRKLNVDDKNINASNSKLKSPDLSGNSADEN